MHATQCFTHLQRLPVQLQPLIAYATVEVQLHQPLQRSIEGWLEFIDLSIQQSHCPREILAAYQACKRTHCRH
jgi:hypothetical protein